MDSIKEFQAFISLFAFSVKAQRRWEAPEMPHVILEK